MELRPIYGTLPVSSWRDFGKQLKHQAKICTQDIMNTKQEC
jgi:hypothetical protein